LAFDLVLLDILFYKNGILKVFVKLFDEEYLVQYSNIHLFKTEDSCKILIKT